MFMILTNSLLEIPGVVETDLAFAITANAPDSTRTFRQMKNILQSIIQKYGRGKIRYAVITFGNTPEVKVDFNSNFASDQALVNLLNALPKTSGASLDKAMEEARKLFKVKKKACQLVLGHVSFHRGSGILSFLQEPSHFRMTIEGRGRWGNISTNHTSV